MVVAEDAGTFNFTLTANGSGNISIDYTGVNLTSINYTDVGPYLSQLHGIGELESIQRDVDYVEPAVHYLHIRRPHAGQQNIRDRPGFTSMRLCSIKLPRATL